MLLNIVESILPSSCYANPLLSASRAVIHDKAKLEEMLCRAQFAILNSTFPPSYFEDIDADDFHVLGPTNSSVRILHHILDI